MMWNDALLVLRIWIGIYILSKAIEKIVLFEVVEAKVWHPKVIFMSHARFREIMGGFLCVEAMYSVVLIASSNNARALMVASIIIFAGLTVYGVISLHKTGYCGCGMSRAVPAGNRNQRAVLLLTRNGTLLIAVVVALQGHGALTFMISGSDNGGVTALLLTVMPIVHWGLRRGWISIEERLNDKTAFFSSSERGTLSINV